MWGDSKHELVIFGQGLDKEQIELELRWRLLNDAEIAFFKQGHTFKDPFSLFNQ